MDWRAQLMVAHSEYDNLFKTGDSPVAKEPQLSHPYPNLQHIYSTAIFRGQYTGKPLAPLKPADFEPTYAMSLMPQRRKSTATVEAIAGINFLGSIFGDIVDRSVNIRSQVIDKLPQEPVDGLKLLHELEEQNDRTEIECTLFLNEKIEAVVDTVQYHDNEVVMERKKVIVSKCEDLLTEIMATKQGLHYLIDEVEEIVNASSELTCKLDFINPVWTKNVELQQQNIFASKMCRNFEIHMERRSLPVCNQMYLFLQSPVSYAHHLCMDKYIFVPDELAAIFEFITDPVRRRLPESILSLSLDHCQLQDRDCHSVASALHYFTQLQSLSLRDNQICCAGIISLATVLWEEGNKCYREKNGTNETDSSSLSVRRSAGLPLQALRLDNNNIDTNSLQQLSLAIPKCRYLQVFSVSNNPLVGDLGLYYFLRCILNPLRKARLALVKPTRQRLRSYGGSSRKSRSYGGSRDDSRTEDEDSQWDSEYDTDNDSFYSEELEDEDDDEQVEEFVEPEPMKEEDEDENSVMSESSFLAMSVYSDDGISTEMDEYPLAEEKMGTIETNRLSRDCRRTSELAEAVQPYAAEVTQTKRPITNRVFKSVRYKLMAVIAFLQYRRRGHATLRSINFGGCGLTSASIPMLSSVVLDNTMIVDVSLRNNDFSGGPLLPGEPSPRPTVCDPFVHLLTYGHVRCLDLSSCRLSNLDIQCLTGAKKSPTLHRLQLSGNSLGATSANWVGSMMQEYYLDFCTLANNDLVHSSERAPSLAFFLNSSSDLCPENLDDDTYAPSTIEYDVAETVVESEMSETALAEALELARLDIRRQRYIIFNNNAQKQQETLEEEDDDSDGTDEDEEGQGDEGEDAEYAQDIEQKV